MSARGRLEARLQRWWHAPLPRRARVLLPLEWAYLALHERRRARALAGAAEAPAVPLVVVGNLSVGGTGKTPLVIALAGALRAAGLRVGVLSGGYGARGVALPRRVRASDDATLCGDEAVLLAARIDGPVWAGADRRRAARALLAATPVDVIISDDGMQHYRLARSMEICVLDAARWLGNGHCLPLGPLREPPSRLAGVDFLVANGEPREAAPAVDGVMSLAAVEWRRVADDAAVALGAIATGEQVHAVAGIGNPARFFATLRTLGLQLIEHAFPDHHRFRPAELDFADGLRVVMTEKDAVKCRRFAPADCLALRVEARLPAALPGAVLACIADFSSRGPV